MSTGLIRWIEKRGLFTYYGDNHGARELHDTPRQGNLILRNLFDEAHNSRCSLHFPPILLFGNTGTYRDVQFLGLAVPGAECMGSDDDLVAVWRTSSEQCRFQNYRAIFTVLDVPIVARAWINDIKLGKILESPHVPAVWLDWVRTRRIKALRSKPIITVRSKQMQIPDGALRTYVISSTTLTKATHMPLNDARWKLPKCSFRTYTTMN